MRTVLIPVLILHCLGTTAATSQTLQLREQPAMPNWYYADSTWVRDVQWADGSTINNRIVVVSFRNGVTSTQRASVYQRVNARAVYYEKAEPDPPIFYMIEANADPEALGVKRAVELLKAMPEIRLATYDAQNDGGEPL